MVFSLDPKPLPYEIIALTVSSMMWIVSLHGDMNHRMVCGFLSYSLSISHLSDPSSYQPSHLPLKFSFSSSSFPIFPPLSFYLFSPFSFIRILLLHLIPYLMLSLVNVYPIFFFLHHSLVLLIFPLQTDDVIRARLRTMGVQEHRFTFERGVDSGREWRIYDIGGTRSQVRRFHII